VKIHPSGKFLYGSNRGHDSIAVFTVDQDSGHLTPVGYQPVGGKWPRHFNIDPSGKWLLVANQRSDNLTVFRIDQASGQLTPAGEVNGIGSPVCVLFTAIPGA
jgi:6-phosphogluconolactonase